MRQKDKLSKKLSIWLYKYHFSCKNLKKIKKITLVRIQYLFAI